MTPQDQARAAAQAVADCWQPAAVSGNLNAAERLEEARRTNAMLRDDILQRFAPLLEAERAAHEATKLEAEKLRTDLAEFCDLKIKSLNAEPGMFTGEMLSDLVPIWAQALADCLDTNKAENLVEFTVFHPSKGPLVLSLRKKWGKTDMELLSEERAAHAETKQKVAVECCHCRHYVPYCSTKEAHDGERLCIDHIECDQNLRPEVHVRDLQQEVEDLERQLNAERQAHEETRRTLQAQIDALNAAGLEREAVLKSAEKREQEAMRLLAELFTEVDGVLQGCCVLCGNPRGLISEQEPNICENKWCLSCQIEAALSATEPKGGSE